MKLRWYGYEALLRCVSDDLSREAVGERVGIGKGRGAVAARGGIGLRLSVRSMHPVACPAMEALRIAIDVPVDRVTDCVNQRSTKAPRRRQVAVSSVAVLLVSHDESVCPSLAVFKR